VKHEVQNTAKHFTSSREKDTYWRTIVWTVYNCSETNWS